MTARRHLSDLAYEPESGAAVYEAVAACTDFLNQWSEYGFCDPRTLALYAYRAAAEEAFEDTLALLAPRPPEQTAESLGRGSRIRHAVQVRGWTLALTAASSHLHATLTRPHLPGPGRWRGPEPALELTVNARLTDPHTPTPDPVHAHDPLRQRALRLWQRWAHRHPAARYQPGGLTRPGVLTAGPWLIAVHRLSVIVERLPEFDCPWHEPFDDGPHCYPEGCTCPRIRPRLEASLTRPERHPEEAPF
ncbi:hypothetical protein ACIOGZ_28975 [Kitasatospora sp. NPDC088160]|uniref:hypothetical protein n=1 Tax=Kitasatospora sp. NPDC088160 TaxID=3364072 RepID=UPI00381E3A93